MSLNRERLRQLGEELRNGVVPSNKRKQKKSQQSKNPTLSTLPAFSGHTAYTDPTPGVGSKGFLTWECPQTKQKKRVIDSEAAEILAGFLKRDLAFNAMASAWHRYKGTHWQPVAQAEPDACITALLYAGTDPIGFRQNYLSGVTNILTRGNMLPLPPEPRGKIPFSNGLLDMATRQLEPITRTTAFTWCIPHNHQDGTDCPRFLAWLRMALSDDEGLGSVDVSA